MSMPGFQEQYPEEDDINRLWDDLMDGEIYLQYEQFDRDQEQQAEAEADFWWYLGLDLICMDDDWY